MYQSKYSSRNWKEIKSQFGGYCSLCNLKTLQGDSIFWNRITKKIQHKYCYLQPLKKFKTKYAGNCTQCHKRIFKEEISFYNHSESTITCEKCVDLKKSCFKREIQDFDQSFQKTIDAVECLYGRKVTLVYDNQSKTNHTMEFGENEFKIVLNGDMPLEPVFFHEIGHVIFTDFESIKQKIPNLFNKILKHLSNEIGYDLISSQPLRKFILNYLKDLFNIIEDIRVEYLLSKINSSHEKLFHDITVRSGKTDALWEDNPSSYLLAQRFHCSEIIPFNKRDEIENIFKSVKTDDQNKLFKIMEKLCLRGIVWNYILTHVQNNISSFTE